MNVHFGFGAKKKSELLEVDAGFFTVNTLSTMLSVHISNYKCTLEVYRAREMRKRDARGAAETKSSFSSKSFEFFYCMV